MTRVYVGGGYPMSTTEPVEGYIMTYGTGWDRPWKVEKRHYVRTSYGATSFTFPSNTISATVELVGGGGSSGAYYSGTSSSTVSLLASGAGGGYFKGFISQDAIEANSVWSMQVGNGAITETRAGFSGKTGSSTYFGPAVAYGGKGGVSSMSANGIYVEGPTGGSASRSASGNGKTGQSLTTLYICNGSQAGSCLILDSSDGVYKDGTGLARNGGPGSSHLGLDGRDKAYKNWGATLLDWGASPATGYGAGGIGRLSGTSVTAGAGSTKGTGGIIILEYDVLVEYTP